VVMKRGPLGAAAARGPQTCSAPALPLAEVRDTTGAGDCFNAGFIYGMLQGLSLEGCLRAGSVCGSLAVAGGGARGIRSAGQVEGYLTPDL
jgi:sugar/nucleoside kinase (ribokinase family)